MNYNLNLYEDPTYTKFKISYFAKECYKGIATISSRSFNEEVKRFAFEKLLESTKRGFPMCPRDDMINYLTSRFDTTKEEISKVIDKEIESGELFH